MAPFADPRIWFNVSPEKPPTEAFRGYLGYI